MRHLKLYEEFNLWKKKPQPLVENIVSKQDIIDICADITDDQGFIIRFDGSYYRLNDYIAVIRKHDFSTFVLSEAEEVLLRLIDYLGDKLHEITVSKNHFEETDTEGFFHLGEINTELMDHRFHFINVKLKQEYQFK